MKIVQNEQKKWLINVSDEPNMIQATLDNGRSLKHVFYTVFTVPSVSSYEKGRKYVKFKLIPNQGLFHACSNIKDGESGIC